MDISIFTDKANIPTPEELQKAVGSTLHLWLDIADYAHKNTQRPPMSGTILTKTTAGALGSRIKNEPTCTFYPAKDTSR